jgi:hypothetical protein
MTAGMRAQLKLIKIDSTHADVHLMVNGIPIEGITVQQESWGPLQLIMPDAKTIPAKVRKQVTSPDFVGELLVAVAVRWPNAEYAS